MTLQITTEEAERLARKVAQLTGESISQAVVIALRERLVRLEQQRQETEQRVDELMAIIERGTDRPILDARHPDDINGYDEHGVPS